MERVTTTGLADALKAARGLPSSYAVAKLLGLTSETVRSWYRRGTTMDDATAVVVADLLQLDPEGVVLWLQVERMEKRGNDNLSHLWQGIAERVAA